MLPRGVTVWSSRDRTEAPIAPHESGNMCDPLSDEPLPSNSFHVLKQSDVRCLGEMEKML